MKYILIVVLVLVGLSGVILMAGAVQNITADDPSFATIAWAGEEVKDTNGDGVLSGRELTIDDWIRCRDQNNADNEASGSDAPKLTVLPTQREDGEWTFNGGNKELNPTGEFYSCGRVIPTPDVLSGQ